MRVAAEQRAPHGELLKASPVPGAWPRARGGERVGLLIWGWMHCLPLGRSVTGVLVLPEQGWDVNEQGFNERCRHPATRHRAIDTASARPELCRGRILLHL